VFQAEQNKLILPTSPGFNHLGIAALQLFNLSTVNHLGFACLLCPEVGAVGRRHVTGILEKIAPT
jgi:hypothetical protein